MTEPQVPLPHNADELLRNFPVTEPDFEAQAKAIEARLQAPRVAAALSDDDLFKSPELAAEPNQPPLPSQVRATAPKSHFAEMARRSLHKPEDDSAALAKELLAATAQSRRPSPELLERMRAAGKTAPTSTPLPLSEPRRERNSGVVARASAPNAPSAVVEKPAADKRGVVIALGGIALAAAAAVVLFVNGSAETSPAATSAARAAAAASQARVAAAEPASAAPVTASPRAEGVVSPDALPPVAAAEAKSPDSARAAKPTSATAAGPATKPSAPPHGAVPRIELTEDEPQPVAAAEPHAKPVDASEPPLRPAEGNTGSVPLQPSSGAVSTALGAVRSGAQACLAGQTDPVTATVTFASDGHVLRVSASGPSGACIQGALSKAHIAPFAKESFSATTTIRPP